MSRYMIALGLTGYVIAFIAGMMLERVLCPLCSLTTNHVETPTSKPNMPTMASDALMTSSQPWRDNPQIVILSLFDKIACGIIGAAGLGLMVIAFLFFKRAWRDFRCH